MIIYNETLKSKPFLLDFICSGLNWDFDNLELSQINSKEDFIERQIEISASPLKLTKRLLRYPLNVIYSLATIKDAYCSQRLLNFLANETSILEGSFNPHIVDKDSGEILLYLFTCFYMEHLGGQKLHEGICRDYVHLSLRNNRLPDLRIKSFKRIWAEHDRQADEFLNNDIQEFSIPDPGMLPYEKDSYVFTCICSKSQLLNESIEMHHCVAAYAQDIIAGESVIYSIKGKERATAEFSDYGKGYRLIQVKSYYNKNVSDNLTKMLEDLIECCGKRGPDPTSTQFSFVGNEIPF